MRKTLFAVLAFVLALLILTAACSPKDKPADDRKKPQESNSTMPDDPQKPGEPIFFYQVISREEIEEATGLKVLACREAKDSLILVVASHNNSFITALSSSSKLPTVRWHIFS
jgi:hypothetical protein